MADYTKLVNTPVSFIDQSTSPAGYPLTSWSWDFGNGSPIVSTKDAVHTYTTKGTYTINHSATNNCGSVGTCAVKTIEIVEELPPAPVAISPVLIGLGLAVGAVGLYFVTRPKVPK